MIVANERLNHDLGGLVQMVFGDRGNDLMSLTSPAPAEGGQENGNREHQWDSSHQNLNGIVAEFTEERNRRKSTVYQTH